MGQRALGASCAAPPSIAMSSSICSSAAACSQRSGWTGRHSQTRRERLPHVVCAADSLPTALTSCQPASGQQVWLMGQLLGDSRTRPGLPPSPASPRAVRSNSRYSGSACGSYLLAGTGQGHGSEAEYSCSNRQAAAEGGRWPGHGCVRRMMHPTWKSTEKQ